MPLIRYCLFFRYAAPARRATRYAAYVSYATLLLTLMICRHIYAITRYATLIRCCRADAAAAMRRRYAAVPLMLTLLPCRAQETSITRFMPRHAMLTLRRAIRYARDFADATAAERALAPYFA